MKEAVKRRPPSVRYTFVAGLRLARRPQMSSPPVRAWRFLVVFAVAAGLTSCSQLPTSGPNTDQVRQQAETGTASVQVVEVTDSITRRLLSQRRQGLFSESLGVQRRPATDIAPGDTLEVNIWEAPPATLFGGGALDPRNPSLVRAITLPEQMVDRDGFIGVPFAGRIAAAGKTPNDVETEIARRLKGKANQPEVLVRLVRNPSASVTVVGEVTNSLRMPLTANGERLLDALAAAGGVRQPVHRMTLQVTRGEQYLSMPLDQVIRDPAQNVPLRPGDVVTALHQPLSFTALGATGRNEEIPFEAQGITLAQALGRVGGLQDNRSDPQGVFIFRLEQQTALDWPRQPVAATPDGLVPVVYQVNLRDARSFFVMQSFPVQNRDVVYVSNAPSSELQKFLNLVFSVAYPVFTSIQVVR